MTWLSGGGRVVARGLPVGLLVLAGCAWFQNPPAPSGVSASAAPGRPFGRSFGDSLRSPADTLTTPPPDSVAVAEVPGSSPSAVAPPADTVHAGAPLVEPDTSGVLPDVEDWNLGGETLAAETGPEGQVIRVVNPVITHGTAVIQADQGSFEVDADRAILEGHVRLDDEGLRGTANHARYYREQELLLAEGDVTMETDTLRVRGDEGSYDRGQDVVLLKGAVEGWRGARRITAQEAEWFRLRDEIFFRGNAVVRDTVDNSTLSGERIRYDLVQDRAEVLESPTLLLESGNESPIRISAITLNMDPDGNASASGSVEIIRGGVTAASDSAYFSRSQHLATLFGYPSVTERDGTMTGDTLLIHFDAQDALTHLEMRGDAGLRFQPLDSARVGEVSTVTGDSLTMYFVEEEADRVVVFGNARSTYRPSPEDRSEGVGTNVVEGDSITILLEEGAIDRVRVTGGARGTFRFGRVAADTSSAASAPDAAGTEAAAQDTTHAEAAAPDTTGATQKVVYSARTVEYVLHERTVDLFEDATLEYGQLTLTAGKVRFYADRKYLEAEDDPVLVDRGGGESKVVGTHMDYNLESREGTIAAGRTRNEDGFIYSERLRQVGEKTFLARGGNFTTCDLAEHAEDPHFHFTSKRMKIYLDDKVVAKPVVMYIRDIPILAIPYYVFSIRKGRHSGFLFDHLDLGLGSNTGRFIRNLGYYWAASQYWDAQLTFDYSEKSSLSAEPSRFVGRGLVKYAKRYLMSGSLNVAKTLSSTSDQHDITGAHQMTLGEWSLTARAEFRDAQFREDEPLGPDFGARLDRKLLSDLSLSRSFDFGGSFFLTFRREEDLDAELGDLDDTIILTETLPQYSFSLNSRPLGRVADETGAGARLPALANLRFGFNSSGSSTRTVNQLRTITPIDSVTIDTTFTENSERRTGLLHSANLSDTRKLFGALSVSPGVRVNEHWVDREFSPEDTVKGFNRAATWNASVGANTVLYGTFGGVGAVEGVRHTFRPGATFTYQPEFQSLTFTEMDTTGGDTVFVRQNRFPGVSARESRTLSLTLDQSFQAKVRSGETTRKIDLFRWTLGSGFDFLAEERGERGWRTVGSTFDLSQIYGVGLSFNSTHDPYHQFRFQTFQLTTGYRFQGKLPGGGDEAPSGVTDEVGLVQEDLESRGADLAPRDRPASTLLGQETLAWNAAFSFSYAGQRGLTGVSTTAAINAGAEVQITTNWSVALSNVRWDVTNGEILGNNLTLTRKLHCWEAQFTRSELGDDTTFYFRLNIGGMPDIRYEQGRRGGTGLGDFNQFLP